MAKSPVPVKILLGSSGLGAGANPEKGKEEAQQNLDDIKNLFSDGTQMAFITAGMGGGTGTGAAPIIAGVAKQMGILTIGIVTIPFYFEKRNKIIEALKGVEELRKNVDSLLIINNERLCDVYSDSELTVKEAFKRVDSIVNDATKSISELITVDGTVNLDFRDVETTMRGGGGAIMAIGRASGEHRVEKAFINALDSPLLYGNDISKAKRILFNVYTSNAAPLIVKEMNEVDSFMEELDPDIKVIWGLSDDDMLEGDAKVTILATGLDDSLRSERSNRRAFANDDDSYYDELIDELYCKYGKDSKADDKETADAPVFKVGAGDGNGNIIESPTVEDEPQPTEEVEAAKPMPEHLSFIDKLKGRIRKYANDLIAEDEPK